MRNTQDDRLLFPVEARAIAELLSGEDSELNKLRAQASTASVARRRLSPVGCFTELVVPNNYPAAKQSRMVFSSLCVDHPKFPAGGVGYVLFIENGVLSELEAFVYEGDMPDLADIVPAECVWTHETELPGSF